jgi:hypothetical protein
MQGAYKWSGFGIVAVAWLPTAERGWIPRDRLPRSCPCRAYLGMLRCYAEKALPTIVADRLNRGRWAVSTTDESVPYAVKDYLNSTQSE